MSTRRVVGLSLSAGVVAAAAMFVPATASAAPVLFCHAAGPGADTMKEDLNSLCRSVTYENGTALSGATGATAFSMISDDGTVGSAWAVGAEDDTEAAAMAGVGSNVHAVAVGTPGAESSAHVSSFLFPVQGFVFAGPGGEASIVQAPEEIQEPLCRGFAIVATTVGSCFTVR